MQKALSRTGKNTGRSSHSSLYRLEFMYPSFRYRPARAVRVMIECPPPSVYSLYSIPSTTSLLLLSLSR
jgi:hypothetical protein